MSIKNQLKIYIIALIFIPIFSISILPIHQHFSSHTRVFVKDFKKIEKSNFLNKIKEVTQRSIPTLIISARDADEDIIKGLKLGADDFITKPFSPRVLVAKIEACLRRVAETTAAAEETLTFGDYTILINSNILKKGNIKIQLSAKEYAVLEYLARHPNVPISPEQIYTDVWKAKYGDITAVAVYIQRLRKKIEKNPANPDFIKTEFGLGYKFVTGK